MYILLSVQKISNVCYNECVEYEKGAEYINDMIDVALQFGFIERINNITYALIDFDTGEVMKDPETGELLQNKKKYLINYLNTHENFRNNYMEMLNKHISASNDVSLLDKETQSQIEAEENAIE